MSNSKWNADAEAAMMGFVIPVHSNDHLRHLVNYIVRTLTGSDESAAKVYENATKRYNSEEAPVTHVVCNVLMNCFRVITFVRECEGEKVKMPTKNGQITDCIAWVENIDAPDCSELGYVGFEFRNHKVCRAY